MNIVLIGLKNSGKTTVGKDIARELSREFIDTDELLVKQYQEDTQNINITIADIHTAIGDAKFRELEYSTLSKLSKVKGSIIASGGGTYLIKKNIDVLQSLGKLYYLYLTRDEFINNIKKDNTSTYLKDHNLVSIFNEREVILNNIYDFKIKVNNKSVSTLVNEVRGYYHGF